MVRSDMGALLELAALGLPHAEPHLRSVFERAKRVHASKQGAAEAMSKHWREYRDTRHFMLVFDEPGAHHEVEVVGEVAVLYALNWGASTFRNRMSVGCGTVRVTREACSLTATRLER